MEYIFSECSNLKELDPSNFNTSNTKYKQETFFGCIKLPDKIKNKILNGVI